MLRRSVPSADALIENDLIAGAVISQGRRMSKDEFICKPRGTVTVEGGETETWYVLGPDPSAQVPSGEGYRTCTMVCILAWMVQVIG